MTSVEDTSRTVRPERLPRLARQEPGSKPVPAAADLPVLAVVTAATITPVGQPLEAEAVAELALTSVLGEGGMGRVLGGTQRSLGREVAVKVLHDGGARDELVREARIVGRVEHPNVVPVHLLARTTSGEPVLVMKRIEGVRWLDLCRDPAHPHFRHIPGAASVAEAARPDRLETHLEIFEAVCHAVAGAHERGIVHRDVKLENVMVGRFGEIYLTDWGIALDRAGRLAREDAPFAGTPTYAAPEMMAGDEFEMDERTDVYLLGATLHHAITGKPRHEGETIYAVLGAAAESAPPRYGSEVAPELGAILARAMHREPRERFATVLALRDAVRAHRSHRHAYGLLARASTDIAAIERALADAQLDGVDRTFVSALIALEAAEREWPEAPALRAMRVELFGAILEVQLRRGSLAAAREALAALAAVGADGPEERARVDALAEELARRDASAHALERIEQDHDLAIGQAIRRKMFATMVAIIVPVAIAALAWQLFGHAISSAPSVLLIAAAGLTAFSCFVWLHRATLLSNRANRDVVATMACAMGFVVIHRALALRIGLEVRHTLALDLAGLAAVLAASSSLAFPRLWPAAAVVGLGSAACLVSPDHSPYVFAATVPMFALAAHRAFAASGRSR